MIFSKYGERLAPPNEPAVSAGYFRKVNEMFDALVNSAEERERVEVLQRVISGIISAHRGDDEQHPA